MKILSLDKKVPVEFWK